MQFYRNIKLSIFFLLWFQLALSQNFPSKNYTATNELPNNSVRSLLVDSNNILWIGTENGVVRKENDVFTYFFEEDGLALNSCWAIAEDPQKKIWFGSYGNGISIYDGKDFKIISEVNGLVHNEITRLFQNKKFMFVGTSDGVSVVNIENYKVQSLKTPEDRDLFRVQDFFEFEDKVYVVTYNSGTWKIEWNKGKPILVKVNNYKFTYAVFKDGDSIYSSNKSYFTKSSLNNYLTERGPCQSEKLGQSIIWDYEKTKNKKIYAAAWGIFESGGGIYEVSDYGLIPKATEFKISSNEVIALAYDSRFDKLYVGTRDAGLYEIQLNPIIKFHAAYNRNILGFARTTNTSAILSSQGMSLNHGTTKNFIALSQFKNWQLRSRLTGRKLNSKFSDPFYELNPTIASENINFYDIKVDKDLYWINSNIGIFAINEDGDLKHYLPIHSEEINFTEDGSLIETHPYGGLRIFSDLEDPKYSYYDTKDVQTPTMIVNSLKSNDQTYLVSVFSGLYKHDTNGFSSYVEKGIWKEKQLRHIIEMDDRLVISSEFGDIYIIQDHPEFKILNEIPRANIQGNTISFLDSYNGAILIGTEKGLTVFKNNRYIFFDEEQGLEQPFLSAEVKDHQLSIGSNNGFYKIDLKAVMESTDLINKLELKEIFINNDLLFSDKFNNKEQVDLEYDENTVLLKFSTNAHPYPHKLTYQYRLEPDKNWSLSSTTPEIFLPFLPAKNYEVEVKVLDQSTGLTYRQSLINLNISPPYWKTWWFTLLAVLLIILIIVSIYSYQIQQSRKFEAQKSMIQKRFEETKMEALLSQMNPHFIFNAMNSIQNYILDSDIDKASLFLGDFAKLIRLNLDHCTKPKILLVEEIEYLQAYIRVENTRFNNSIAVSLEVDQGIDTYDIEIPTMIIQTFIENVFVHAFPASISNSKLNVSFKMLSETILQCKIIDNGIGYSFNSGNKIHASKGVKLVKERLVLMGYDLEKALQIHSVKNEGTTVILNLAV